MDYPIKKSDFNNNIEFYSEVLIAEKEASDYLKGFDWCNEVQDSVIYVNLGEKLCVFAFKIDNTASIEDNVLWAVVGDIPSVYLDTFGVKSTKEVLRTYVGLADDWIANVKLGQSVDDCYPFNAKPTNAIAELLEKKVFFIKNVIIDNIEDIYISRF